MRTIRTAILIFSTVIVAFGCCFFLIPLIQRPHAGLTVRWDMEDQALEIYPLAESGTFVVTHLTYVNESHRLYAALEPAVAIWDTGWCSIPLEKVQSLKWINDRFEEFEGPKPGDDISAIFVRSDVSRKSSAN